MRHEPGIYFGMPEDEYHADDSCGSTDIKRLLISPSDYWWNSDMNPFKPEDTKTPSKAWGSAFHTLILEGPDVFARKYKIKPDKSQYTDLLVTADDVREWLRDHDLAVGGSKKALVERALGADPRLKIWDQIMDEFESSLGDALPITRDQNLELQLSAAMITKNPVLADEFENGVPEVSIFWLQRGVPCKARIDYMRVPRNVDLKSFRTMSPSPIDTAVFRAIANYRYDIQAVHYCNGRLKAMDLIREGKVYGEPVPNEKWLEAIASTPNFGWKFVFYQASGAPIAKGYNFPRKGMLYDTAEGEISIAIDRWLACMEKFGTSVWITEEADHEIATEDMPPWMGI